MTHIDNVLRVAHDPIMRKRIIARMKQLIGKLPGCATVQSLVYWAAKGKPPETITLAQVWPGTDAFRDARLKAGWKRCTDVALLQPGYVLFSVDKAGRKGAPDHVYLFMSWADEAQRVAWIFDNNSANLTCRNLGKGCWHKGAWLNRTPFEYALYTTS